MSLRKVFYSVRRLSMRLLVRFFPRPGSAPEGAETVTEKGVRLIVRKLFLYFVISIWVSNGLCVLRHIGVLRTFEINVTVSGILDPVIKLSLPEALLFSLSLIYYGIMPFLRYLYKWLRVTGIIYAISIGFIFSCGMGLVKLHLIGVIMLSVVSTAILSLLPLYLLKYRHLRLPKYVSRITYVSFAVLTLGGSVLNILNMIPCICNLTGYLFELSKYTGIIIAIDAVKVIVAFLFMFLAYDRVSDYSERNVSREYEWLAAFTGFYTVMLIVLKIFEMLVFILK